ncbi:MAG: FAD-dependent monooxygenase [Peptococcaceae bacterium]|nr:FAD-dependent monooxygenase [Peptococcaceae bacterium]
MIRITNVKLPLDERGQVQSEVLKRLGIGTTAINGIHIYKESIDARKKDSIHFVYTVDVEADHEVEIIKRLRNPDVQETPELEYERVKSGASPLKHRPVVIGSGPAGLFSALLLSEQGYKPIILERGKDVIRRSQDVGLFWSQGILSTESNVQFGEGGAGTFSDGKLTTLIKDRRCRKVLQDLVSAGAPEDILYSYKPHVGTDILRQVVKGIRERIITNGGEVRFEAKVTDIHVERGAVVALRVNGNETIPVTAVILAVGHSARDTFSMLLGRGVTLVPKPFSIGARIEHPQALIDEAQYGRYAGHKNLGAADYKLSYHSKTERSAYTFCMCPGGLVVAAASEEGRVVTNGMSEHARTRPNANSALLVGVSPEDYEDNHPLAGVEFQRHFEERAFVVGGGKYRAPVQTVRDFLAERPSSTLGSVVSSYRPGVEPADLRQCLPNYVVSTMREALLDFDRKLRGFSHPEALLTGVETRSSSPVRITRGENGESNIAGLYPAGEGAGYAGGIISAAVDGMKAAEAIMQKFLPLA